MSKYDFSGWATKANLKCSDGRTILKDAFKDNDGQTVPLVWNHQHNDPLNVLGHALLENRNEGVYAYCKFNDSMSGQQAKELVKNGDITQLSIYANKLKQQGSNVLHGAIREVSLVLAGANPGASIQQINLAHSEDGEDSDEGVIYTGEDFVLSHSDEEDGESEKTIVHADGEKGEKEMPEEKQETGSEKTVADVLKTLNDEQEKAVYYAIGKALEANGSDEGDEDMKHNVFDQEEQVSNDVLSHADEVAIMTLAKKPGYTFQSALTEYIEDKGLELQHGFSEEALGQLFPEYKLLNPGAPQQIDDDYNWCDRVLSKVHKSPISRVRTRHVDLTKADIRAMGYKKGTEKKLIGQLSLLGRSCDPQTVYIKEKLNRDDIIDITDFSYADYMKAIMRKKLNREIATAILVGDGRADGDEAKIKEAHIRPIWTDAELYTMHVDVDFKKFEEELQGTDTSKHFGENFVKAEAMIQTALYAREKYKGSGNLDFYCPEHTLNVMLLSRDLNGRRMFNSKEDLKAQLNVREIITVNQFEGLQRTTEDGAKKKLIGIFVNLADYQVGSTKGGEITNFEDFDIDFNQYKYLMETRLSGSLTVPFSAIALEEPVATTSGGSGTTDPEEPEL